MGACDFSFDKPNNADLQAQSVNDIGVYLNDPGGKGVTQQQLASYMDAGFNPWLIFETSGQDASDKQNGIQDALNSQELANALGYPNAVRYFAIDEENAPNLLDYIQGLFQTLPSTRVGIYGGFATVQAAHDEGVPYLWQTYAWSDGQEFGGAQIYQYENDVNIGSGTVDLDVVRVADFGGLKGISATPSPAVNNGLPSYPLPPGYYYGPYDGPIESVSGRVGPYGGPNGAPGLKVWQQKMASRGWTIVVDGLWGPQTAGVAHNFECQKGLTIDEGLIGPQVWNAAWTAPWTPGTNP